MTFTCPKCNRTNLLANEIYWNLGHVICKTCKSDYQKKHYDGEEGKRRRRNKTLKWKYGITIEQYEEILANQDNQCLICEREFSNTVKPDVDHNHLTKKVRGIVCHACNLAIGHLREDLVVVQRLLDYLESNTTQPNQTGESNVATAT